MTTRIERRAFPTEFETRSKGEHGLIIEGYAYRFHKRSQNLGGFVEQILPGAGEEAAANDDIRALFNHDSSLILGRNTSGTLRLAEDSDGLFYEVEADMRQSYVRDLALAMERGDVSGSSFGMKVIGDDWSLTEDDFPLRSISKMGLFDVSPVTFPAYTSASSGVGKRAIEAFCEERGLDPNAVDLREALKPAEDEPDPYDFRAVSQAQEADYLALRAGFPNYRKVI